MYHIEEAGIDELDAKEWNDLLLRSEVCDAFQTYEWARALRNSLSVEPRFLVIRKKGEAIGGVVFIKKKLFGILDSYEVRGGPLYVRENRVLVMEAVLRALKRKKGKSVYTLFVPFPMINRSFKEMFDVEGYYSLPFRTLIIDLRRSIEDIWHALDKKARWGVRKAEGLGVKVKIASDWQEWEEYHNLHIFHSRTRQYATYPYNFFKEMFKLHHRNMARLFLAKYEEKTIAGSLFLIYRKNMVFLQNASLDVFLKHNPNNIIQWRSIEWAGKNGVATYDINGLPWEGTTYLRGIYQFKKRWDGNVQWYHYYLNRRLLCSGVHLIRTSFLAWDLLRRLKKCGIVQR